MTKTLFLLTVLACVSCEAGSETQYEPPTVMQDEQPASTDDAPESTPVEQPADAAASEPQMQTATLGAGCFWCIEAVLEQIEGVTDVRSGYMGGKNPNPTYREVCSGTSGHAEVVQVDFDTRIVSFEEILDWFWRLHDPTTLNRQGADVGSQYRSAIFFHSPEQEVASKQSLASAQDAFIKPIVTEITALSDFYVAEDYHQDYYRQNSEAGYCQVVIKPKLEKLKLKK